MNDTKDTPWKGSGPQRTGPCVRCNALQDKLRRAQEELKQLRTLAVLKGAQ